MEHYFVTRIIIAMEKKAFEKFKGLLTAKKIPIKPRKRFANCLIHTVVLYETEFRIEEKDFEYFYT